MLHRHDPWGIKSAPTGSMPGTRPDCNAGKLFKKGVISFFLVCWLFFFPIISPAWARDNGTDLVTNFLDFYGKVISPVDGERCPMYPSCSHYTRNSIEKHGFAMGWIMGMDRIVRCGGDDKNMARPHFEKSKKLIYDPVGNNDFWWSHK